MAVVGLLTVNHKEVLEVDADPSTAGGIAAPLASLAMWDNGSVGRVYIKTGAANTAWQQIDVPEGGDWTTSGNALTGGGATAPNEWFGSSNDFDVLFKRNNAELARLCADGLLVGLNASLGGRLQAGVAALGDVIFTQSSPNGGSGQRVIHVTRQYKCQTTDATPTALGSIAVPAESRIQTVMRLGCNQHGGTEGSAGDGATYIRTWGAKRLSAGNAVLSKVQTDFTEEDVAGFNVGFAVATNNIEATVTGGADRNLAWSAHAEIMIFKD